jgi:hypothetical protein
MSDDDSEDPFENLDDAVGDREGDPFETLDNSRNDSDQSDDTEQSEFERGDQPDPEQLRESLEEAGDDSTPERGLFAPAADDTESASSPAAESSPASSEPTEGSEMEFDVGRREDADPTAEGSLSDVGRREGDPFDSFEDAFEEMDVDKLDPDVVWQDLTSAESRGSVGTAQERTYADVSKHSYCEGCEHFSPPPNVSCGHEGTEIVEFLDMETVRVVDCPVVTEREELEDDDGFGDA